MHGGVVEVGIRDAERARALAAWLARWPQAQEACRCRQRSTNCSATPKPLLKARAGTTTCTVDASPAVNSSRRNPEKAESVKLLNQIDDFPSGERFSAVGVYRRDGGLTAADRRTIAEDRAELTRVATEDRSEENGFYINRFFIFLGKRIRHCGYYPSWNLRLFRHAQGRYECLHGGDTGSGDNEVHEHVVVRGPTSRLRCDRSGDA